MVLQQQGSNRLETAGPDPSDGGRGVEDMNSMEKSELTVKLWTNIATFRPNIA